MGMRLRATLQQPLRYLTTPTSLQSFLHTSSRPTLTQFATPLYSCSRTHNRSFSNTTANMTSSSTFFEAVKARRTIYQLSSESPVPDSKIKEIVKEAVLHVPSSFNSQSTRVVVLLGDEHKKLWGDIVKPAVKAVAPQEAWPASEQRLSGFQAAYGTVLFYEEPKVVAGLQQKFPLYADKFPQWSEHTNALHHYNPLIDEKIAATWNVPLTWSLKAQLVFGKPAGKPMEKTFQPLEERLFIHGAKE